MFPEWRDRVYNVTEIVSDEMALTYFNCGYVLWEFYTWGIPYGKSFDEDGYYSYPVSLL